MILGDYHTHTVYSHGKGSVEENVAAAAERGLKEVAITDHGFGHMFYNLRKSDFRHYLDDVALCRAKYPDIKIYAGVEANFVGVDGQVDLPDKARERLDIALCGFHKSAARGFFGFFTFTLPRLLPGKNSAKTVAKNTDAYIKAMDKYMIDVITHPGYGAKVDLKAVGEAAKTLGVLLELNGKRVNMTDDEILMLSEIGCTFICNSDAHSPGCVGDVRLPAEIIGRLKIGGNVANWDKLPVFRSQKEK